MAFGVCTDWVLGADVAYVDYVLMWPIYISSELS
jgi:hypothetical protein